MNFKETARKIAAAPAGLASRQSRTIAPPAAATEPFQAWSEPNPENIESSGDARREGARALAASALYQRPHALSQIRDDGRLGDAE